MTDNQLLTAIRVGMALMAAVCVVGLFRATSAIEVFFLLALIITIVYGLRATREF